MLPTERANGLGLTMACGECAENLIEANSSTHKLYIFNYFMMIYTILPRYISTGMKQMVLFFLLFLLNAQSWEDIDLSFFEGKNHIIADGEWSATAIWKLKHREH